MSAAHADEYGPTDWVSWATVDAVADVLDDTVTRTPSDLARRASTTTNAAHHALRWLVTNNMAVPVGNGAWTRYRARRAGDRLNEES